MAFAEQWLPSGRTTARLTLVSAEPNAFPGGPIVGRNGKTAGFRVGTELGDQLTDNSRRMDAYRYHDAVHMGYLGERNIEIVPGDIVETCTRLDGETSF